MSACYPDLSSHILRLHLHNRWSALRIPVWRLGVTYQNRMARLFMTNREGYTDETQMYVVENGWCLRLFRPFRGRIFRFFCLPSLLFGWPDKASDPFLDYLKKAGIKTMGAGKSIKEARKPLYLKIKGKTIALAPLSLCCTLSPNVHRL